VTLPLFSLAQTTQAFARKVTASPHGPVTHLRVVGIEASVSDFPSNAGSFALYTSPAFDRAVGTKAAVGTVYQVRLRHGRYDVPRFQAEVIGLSKHASVYVGDVNSALAGVQGSIHPQAIGWWLLALLEALAGLALIGQALFPPEPDLRDRLTSLRHDRRGWCSRGSRSRLRALSPHAGR
jgi:hypothetical protein